MVKPILTWKTPEYFPKDRSPDWYWAFGIIATAIIVTSILLNNVLLAIFFLIATGTIFIYAKREPDIITIEITEDGVRAGRNLYPFSLLRGFSINGDYDFYRLFLKSTSITNPIVVVPLGKTDPEKVRAVLSDFIPEKEIVEPLSQKLLEYLGF
jgi:hypothetical protein